MYQTKHPRRVGIISKRRRHVKLPRREWVRWVKRKVKAGEGTFSRVVRPTKQNGFLLA